LTSTSHQSLLLSSTITIFFPCYPFHSLPLCSLCSHSCPCPYCLPACCLSVRVCPGCLSCAPAHPTCPCPTRCRPYVPCEAAGATCGMTWMITPSCGCEPRPQSTVTGNAPRLWVLRGGARCRRRRERAHRSHRSAPVRGYGEGIMFRHRPPLSRGRLGAGVTLIAQKADRDHGPSGHRSAQGLCPAIRVPTSSRGAALADPAWRSHGMRVRP
jgi:hypothetical protein